MMQAKRRGVPCNPCFKGFNVSRKRYVIAYGGAGSGKSINVQQLLIARLSDPGNAGLNLLVIRKDLDSHRDSTRAGLIKAIRTIFGDDAREVWDWSESRSGALELRCRRNGNMIVFRGMLNDTQREKLKSIDVENGKIVLVWIEEATALMPHDFDVLDDRLRGELPNGWVFQIYMTFNPVSATHWIKRRFFDVEREDTYICHSTYKDNRFLDEGYVRKMEADREANPEHYQIYGAGEWGEKGGLILTNFRVEKVDQDITHYDSVALGQDFGFNHANAILLLGWKDGEVYVIREHYVTGKTTPEIIADVERSGIFADAKKAKAWMICDAAEPDRIKEWARAGWRARPVDKGKGKATSAAIDWLKARRIHIDASCENTAAEAGEWAWQRDRTTGLYTDEPVPINDDAMAALRYGTEPFRIASSRPKRRFTG